MRKAINSIILFLLVLMLISCEGISIDSENTVYEKGPIVSGRGTIIFLDFEGGCWGIVGDDGKHYYPLGLFEDFKIDGLRVYFKGKFRDDIATFCMWSRVIELITIKRLSHQQNPPTHQNKT